MGEECRPCQTAKYWGAITCVDDSFGIDMAPASSPAQLPNVQNEEPNTTEEEQKSILMQLFEATGGSTWKHNNGWVRHDTVSICDWFGVDCALGTTLVESLDLQSNNLHGRVPASIFRLKSLKKLVLTDNDIFPVRADAVDFFSDIDKSVSLETLDLSSTGLAAVIGIENAPLSLTELHLDSNPFGSNIPNELFSLTNLKVLTLDSCSLSGVIDNSIYLLTNLVLLSASDNNLTGNLPPELSYLSVLSTLRLKNNKLSGTVPSSFNLLTGLTSLDLSGQKKEGSMGLEGPLIELSESPNLKRVDCELH